jgi:hypothetical protein
VPLERLGFDYAENAGIADNYIFDRGRIAVPFCKGASRSRPLACCFMQPCLLESGRRLGGVSFISLPHQHSWLHAKPRRPCDALPVALIHTEFRVRPCQHRRTRGWQRLALPALRFHSKAKRSLVPPSPRGRGPLIRQSDYTSAPVAVLSLSVRNFPARRRILSGRGRQSSNCY